VTTSLILSFHSTSLHPQCLCWSAPHCIVAELSNHGAAALDFATPSETDRCPNQPTTRPTTGPLTHDSPAVRSLARGIKAEREFGQMGPEVDSP
jgi:hypothetical protein